ncbi:Protein N-acetyltransferase, RimJ/RimL family [Quadrisphaera granulorum]|uniref:RimJ/RimL family protein N-acetyltransferase n=1 Tax=Quadrisphaera granulorum TaxID=317664 RepID=A0A316A7A2_9ACTN|nr:GNAT family N-acetyltransferase [Quadrisphaera granulorum]PWJ45617.1 RimJ/RimL family protein N-acetyltransferase [Quadrisphaera granulorum]SZE99148.1 Protein N-acetyltransferase, RimJ/RimL family [Quadrisphaera granulorum]
MRPLAKAELPPVMLQDAELVLRPWRAEDAPARVQAGADPAIRRWTSVTRGADLEQARSWIRDFEAARLRGDALYLALIADGQCVGGVGLIDVVHRHRRAEVGYWLLPEARGHSYVVRAVRALSAWSFRELGLNRLDLYTNTDNEVSMRAAEKAGFTREALLRRWYLGEDGPEDLILFGLVRP